MVLPHFTCPSCSQDVVLESNLTVCLWNQCIGDVSAQAWREGRGGGGLGTWPVVEAVSAVLPDGRLRTTTKTTLSGAEAHRCSNCSRSLATPGLRPCSRSEERQEEFVWQLATTLGRRSGGTFVELGGNDGVASSNTLFLEACQGWRGILIEANPLSFERLRQRRPAAVGIHAAVCSAIAPHTTSVVLAVRASRGAAKRGKVVATTDLSSGVEGVLPHAGHAWLKMEPVARHRVPCAPLHLMLRRSLDAPRDDTGSSAAASSALASSSSARVNAAAARRGVDIFWLDCEGCELDALRSLRFDETSVGLLVVEMRWDDAA